VLEQAIGSEYRIFGKVRVGDIVSVRATAARGAWLRAFQQISAKHFDFVLCDRENFSIRCAIKLADPSSEAQQPEERDAVLENLCRSISLPMARIQGPRDFLAGELRKKLISTMSDDWAGEEPGSDQAFFVGSATGPSLDDPSWTFNQTGTVAGKPGEISDPGEFKATSKLTLDLDR
jgi:hypothetical protein